MKDMLKNTLNKTQTHATVSVFFKGNVKCLKQSINR